MRNLLMLPTPSQASNDTTNSINQIVLQLQKALPEYGYKLSENRIDSEFIAGHAGQTFSTVQVDVAHTHGFYPTAYPNLVEHWHNAANQSVINNVLAARAVTAPSDWVADIMRRDLHLNPTVIPWAIEFDKWPQGENQQYVLWNKTRVDGVCDPSAIVQLAKRVGQQRFLSTFGLDPTPNLKVIGRQPYEKMRDIVRGAEVYLATTKETGGIGILEAMASGVPVLGYRHGNVVNLVQHGVTGYLVEPGDIDGLIEGLTYCKKHRDVLGANARAVASLFTWDRVAEMIAKVYDSLFVTVERPKVAVVIPCHNYAQYVGEAIASVAMQHTDFGVELIIVDDGSSDNSVAAAYDAIGATADTCIKSARVIEQQNSGVAAARNAGILATNAEYICCLDADDKLNSDAFLRTLVGALDADRSLGIVFTGLQPIDEKGTPGDASPWPNGFNWEEQINGKNQVPTCCAFRREAWRRAGGYKAQYQPAEDAELWTRIVALGFRAKQIVPNAWFSYRFHNGSLSDPIRKGKRPEPDWRTDKPWINDKHFPLAAAGVARPVRNYDRPKVSIIVPVSSYHVQYLGQALDSVERQTERYWECIVVNDTGEELTGLGPFPWARVVDTAGRQGAGVARNLGVKHSTAPLIAFLDADDMLLPTFLEKTLRKYQQSGRYVYTDWFSVNKQGLTEEHKTPEFVMGDVFMKPVQHSISIVMKRVWFDQVGGFDENMTSWEDVDFFMRLGAASICGVRVAEPLLVYRYLTGQRRELGETMKSQIIAGLNDRFGAWIRGEKMCGCTNSVSVKTAVQQNGGNAAPIAPDAMVRIIYQGAPGQHEVAFGKHRYGYRQNGDTFYVYATDAANYPNLFQPIAEIREEKQTTPVPPPPPVIRQTQTETAIA